MSDTLKYICPRCDGPLRFNPQKGLLCCEYCDSEYSEDIFKQEQARDGQVEGWQESDTTDLVGNPVQVEHTEKNEPSEQAEQAKEANAAHPIDWQIEGYIKEHEVMDTQPGYSCTSCGAVIVSDGNTIATECMYCTNPTVIETHISGMLTPDYILPFTVSKKDAQDILTKFYKSKKLIPDEFVQNNRIEKVAGMYVPHWLFSCVGYGDCDFPARNSSTHRRGDYLDTVTEHYRASRKGTIKFKHIPVDSSIKMDDNYMDGLQPYNLDELKKFSPQYMAGFFADKFDVDVAECGKRAGTRVYGSLVENLRSTVTGFDVVDEGHAKVEMHDQDIRYALLPVWMFHLKYKDKVYPFAINGQSGKISGILPIDKRKDKIQSWKYFFLYLCMYLPVFVVLIYLVYTMQ